MNKELVRSYFEDYDFGRLKPDDPRFESVRAICTPQYTTYSLVHGEVSSRTRPYEDFQQEMLAVMFPVWSEISFRVLDLIEEDHRVSAQIVIKGTIVDGFHGHTGHGGEVVFGGNNVVEVRDNKISGEWDFEDFAAALGQIGVL